MENDVFINLRKHTVSTGFNDWLNRLSKEHKKIKNKLGTTSHIDSRNEFKNE